MARNAVGSPVNGRLRIVVCDQDPAVNAAVAHLLGVAFSTPALFDGQLPRVSVEVLGDYLVDSSLMAPVQSERFAARRFVNGLRGATPTAVVTFSGVHGDDEISAVISGLGLPVTCLSAIADSGLDNLESLEPFYCPTDAKCDECVTGADAIDAVALADACRNFASLVARDVGATGSGKQ
jgi:hypothetical protein